MDALTASAVNSGNSCKHSRKVMISLANWDICCGNSSGSRFVVIMGVLVSSGGSVLFRFALEVEGRLFIWIDVL
jgi:hypothetical protein